MTARATFAVVAYIIIIHAKPDEKNEKHRTKDKIISLTMASQNTENSTSRKQEEEGGAWIYSFAAAMVPFTAFCYGHSRGVTGRVVERVVRSPVGVYGLLALPFCTLAMEKSIYDTVQAWQGLDPNVRPKDRGGFPSGGAELPSFSLIPVQKKFIRRPTNMAS